MKKQIFKIGLGCCLVAIIFLLNVIINKQNENIRSKDQEKQGKYEEYYNCVRRFTLIEPDVFSSVIEKQDDMIVYFGRKTCSDCVEFVPQLVDEINNEEIEVYYVDTEDKESEELKQIREKYGIEYVPSLLYFYENGKEYKTYDFEEKLSFFLRVDEQKSVNNDLLETVSSFV